jgi:hypothetical protein
VVNGEGAEMHANMMGHPTDLRLQLPPGGISAIGIGQTISPAHALSGRGKSYLR